MTLLRRALICGLFLLVPALAGCGADAPRAEVKAAEYSEQPPLPKPRPKLVEPVAGQAEVPSAVESTGGVARR